MGAALPTVLTHEPVLDIGKPDVISPFRSGDGDHVAASKIGAIDHDAG
jgi:hypothetical protein